jgi:hypothetical protein
MQVPLPPVQLMLTNRQRDPTQEMVHQDRADRDKDPGEAAVTETKDLMTPHPET